MHIFLTSLIIAYVVVFFAAVFIYLKFEWSSEGKDERGKEISNKSYAIVFPLLPLGWFVIQLLNDYVYYFDYETYRVVIWFLVTGLMIIHAANITIMKRIY